MTSETTPRKPATKTCTDHCCGCDAHFHGLGAFDAHRVTLSNEERGCADPADAATTSRDGSTKPALPVWTETGACRLQVSGTELSPVTVWQVYGSEYRGVQSDTAMEE